MELLVVIDVAPRNKQGLACDICSLLLSRPRGDITQTGDERTAAVHPRSSSFILVHPRLSPSARVRASPRESARVRGRARMSELVGARSHACAHVGARWRRTQNPRAVPHVAPPSPPITPPDACAPTRNLTCQRQAPRGTDFAQNPAAPAATACDPARDRACLCIRLRRGRARAYEVLTCPSRAFGRAQARVARACRAHHASSRRATPVVDCEWRSDDSFSSV